MTKEEPRIQVVRVPTAAGSEFYEFMNVHVHINSASYVYMFLILFVLSILFSEQTKNGSCMIGGNCGPNAKGCPRRAEEVKTFLRSG